MQIQSDRLRDRLGDKSGSAFQGFPNRRRKVTAWDIVSTVATVCLFLILLCAMPWGAGW